MGIGNLRNCWQREFTKLRSCVKVEVDVLGSPSLISLTVSVDVTSVKGNLRNWA